MFFKVREEPIFNYFYNNSKKKQVSQKVKEKKEKDSVKLLKDKVKRLEMKVSSLTKKNKSRSELFSSIIHEIKNPIAGIVGLSEVMKDETCQHKNREYTDLMQESSTELMEFVEDFLDMEKINSGNTLFTQSKELHDLNKIIARCAKLNSARALKNNISINIDVDHDLSMLYCNDSQIKQVINNLVSNSIKYSPQDTSITISAHNNDDKVLLCVADEGFGMNDLEIENAFKKYGTNENQNSDKCDSLGLGLSMVKDIVDNHNADITIDSVKNEGTQISIQF